MSTDEPDITPDVTPDVMPDVTAAAPVDVPTAEIPVTDTGHHPLLQRQLKRTGIDDGLPGGEQWAALLERIDRAYHDADRDQELLQRSLEISSNEMRIQYDTLLRSSEERLASERNRLQLVFDSATTGLIVFDRDGTITAANPEAVRLLGEAETLVNHHLERALLIVGRDGEARPLLDAAELETVTGEPRWTRTDLTLLSAVARRELQATGRLDLPPDDGEPGADPASPLLISADVSVLPFAEDDTVAGGLVVVTDTRERNAARAGLAWQASHDQLTGLPNRAVVTEMIEVALVRARRSGEWPSVLFCDLDRFKHVNDSLGHAAGDRLLVVAAERLQRCLRAGDTVARLGGDEFVILCESAGDTEMVSGLAERIIATLSEPFDLSGEQSYVSVSIGIAHAGPMYASADAVLHDADLAMYRAKERGRNRFDVVDDSLRVNAAERVLLERGLRSAIARREVGVAYQPVQHAVTGELVGFEALARWVHPVLGDVRPDRFVPVAEESGLIQALGDRMLDLACRDVATWNRERTAMGLAPLVVHVNISSRDLQSPTLLDRVRDAMRRHDVWAPWLVLEMTETMLLDDPDKALDRLRELKRAGIRVAIDDFGTGYSSLAYLRRYPVHMIKIDREFISEIASSTQDQAIVKAMVDLARGLDHEVLAEGVETLAELEVLRALGCQLVQGYLLGMPMPSEDALLLATSSRRGTPDPVPSASGGTEHLQPQP